MIVIGIESSCDDTSVAIVDDNRNILALNTLSQTAMHKLYGGVVPELASRLHLNAVDNVFCDAMKSANIDFSDVDAICSVAGPGLIGGLIVGSVFAKGVCVASGKPYFPINHLEGHALTARLVDKDLQFPYLLLLVSGGNTLIVLVKGVGDYVVVGRTLDDACGEAFDKVAKLLELPFPNGVEIEKCAMNGDEDAFEFPMPLLFDKSANFSFSGLKSAVARLINQKKSENKNAILSDKFKSDVCASFQKTVCKIFDIKIRFAMQDDVIKNSNVQSIVVAGGAGSNQKIRQTLSKIADDFSLRYVAPPLNLCVDNGAMIAWAGIENIKSGAKPDMGFALKPRWPLSDLTKK